MAQATDGDKVRVHYTGTLNDGTIFDSSEEVASECGDNCGCDDHSNDCAEHDCGCGNSQGPLEFVIGGGNLIPKFEQAVIGLAPGESVKVSIAAEDAYGTKRDEMIAIIERSEIPADINPNPGDQMEVILQDGSPMPVMVVDVTETTITLDGNHPLAGMDLNFDIRLVEIL